MPTSEQSAGRSRIADRRKEKNQERGGRKTDIGGCASGPTFEITFPRIRAARAKAEAKAAAKVAAKAAARARAVVKVDGQGHCKRRRGAIYK